MLLQRHGTRVDPSERTPRPRFHAAYRRNASPSVKRFPSDRTPSVTARASHYVASFTPSGAEMPLRHATAPHALQAVASSRRPVSGHAAHPTTTRTNTPPGARPAPMGRTPDPQLVSKLACPIIITAASPSPAPGRTACPPPARGLFRRNIVPPAPGRLSAQTSTSRTLCCTSLHDCSMDGQTEPALTSPARSGADMTVIIVWSDCRAARIRSDYKRRS